MNYVTLFIAQGVPALREPTKCPVLITPLHSHSHYGVTICIYLKDREIQRERQTDTHWGEKGCADLSTKSLLKCSQQSRSRPNLGTWKFTWDSHMCSRIQISEPLSTASHDVWGRGWIKSGVARLEIGTLIWQAGIPRGSIIHCTTTHTPTVIILNMCLMNIIS